MARKFATAIIAAWFIAGSAHATWFNFSAWDAMLVNGSGQTFVDIYEDLDLRVQSTKRMEPTTAFEQHINLHGNTNQQEFVVEFSEATPVTIEIHTLDLDEMLTIDSGNLLSYEHLAGAYPTIQDGMIRGSGYGISPNGAAEWAYQRRSYQSAGSRLSGTNG